MQKQGSKHRSIKFMLNKSFGKHFNVWMFLQTQQITSSDFSHCNELSLHKKGLFYNLFYNMMLLLLYFVFMYININFLSLSVLTFFALILCFLDTIIYIFPFFYEIMYKENRIKQKHIQQSPNNNILCCREKLNSKKKTRN